MNHDVTEKIIRDILSRVNTSGIAGEISRPNYQREKWRRTAESPEPVAGPATGALLNVPTGTLLGFPQLGVSEHPVPGQSCSGARADEPKASGDSFLGTAAGVCGFVIPEMDRHLLDYLRAGTEDRVTGVLHARRNAAVLIAAADEVFGDTDAPLIQAQIVGGDGEGCGALVVFGTHRLSEASGKVRACLDAVAERQGEVVETGSGRLECIYSPMAGRLMRRLFNMPAGRACGIVAGYPFGVGLFAAAAALRCRGVSPESFYGPSSPEPIGNGFWTVVSGDPEGVLEAVRAARSEGAALLTRLAADSGGDLG